MRSSINFIWSFIIITMLTMTVQVKADIVAFSGDQCDGNSGDNVGCDDRCNDFRNRHSFRVLASGTHCVTLYENTGCSTPVGAISNPGNAACSNVNTGTNVQSFKCSPNSFCASRDSALSSNLKNVTTIASGAAESQAAVPT